MKSKRTDLNRTFARRVGRSLSQPKRHLLETELPKYLYSKEKLENTDYDSVSLEIGFGMGEHFIHQIQYNPNTLHVGVEVYLNGVVSALEKIKKTDCTNFMLWADDLDLILDKIPNKSIDIIHILFPDPWPKTRYLKKRLFNSLRLERFKLMLKNSGIISFASDIEHYFKSTHAILENDPQFKTKNHDFSEPHSGYTPTKYHEKALLMGNKIQFIQAIYQEN